MGSLMAGWDAPIPDPKDVKYQRNNSFTKAEIDAFWKAKKKIEEEHLKEISGLVQTVQETRDGAVLRKSTSLPLTDRTRESIQLRDAISGLEKLTKASDWWTRSGWAFLNEPPVTAMEGPAYKYASQYHVANLANSKNAGGQGISA
ncbi:hypothetical protein H6P81_009642 [Aristolochia fimbriata]|uniref:Uncharacterized protein n=1 Tax=Aristolochia fimbriata TaxID=158543 RepID=A0AAV7ELI2_ARIFI|nr:hypothetical protein H6P81_009642 [Aristolochia fimbriata]